MHEAKKNWLFEFSWKGTANDVVILFTNIGKNYNNSKNKTKRKSSIVIKILYDIINFKSDVCPSTTSLPSTRTILRRRR